MRQKNFAIGLVLLVALSLSLYGCGDESNDSVTNATGDEVEAEKVDTFLDAQLEALDKARAVEADVLQHQQDQLKKIDEQTDG